MRPEPLERRTALDYESTLQRPRGLLRLLRVRHDEPLTGRHVVITLAILLLFSALFVAMLYLFPMGG